MSFVGLFTGLSGIRAAQTGLDTVTHNVANANTPGYTRQRVELAASHTFQSPSGPIGTGVTVQDIARLRDGFLDIRYRSAVGDYAAAGVRSEFLASMERLSGEPDLGIAARMGGLWSALEDWANEPDSAAARGTVMSSLASITEGFRATAEAWDSLGTDTSGRLDVATTAANDTLDSLHQLNIEMTGANTERIGPEVYDQRDRLLDRMADLTGATVRYEENGSVTVSLPGGQTVLSHPDGRARLRVGEGEPPQMELSALTADPDDEGAGWAPVSVTGEVGGLYRAVHEDLPAWRAQLDELATTLATAVNDLNRAGFRADGSAGEDLLTLGDQDGARTLELISFDVAALAAAAATGPDGGPPAAHDGTNARLFADLRTTALAVPGGGRDARLEDQISNLVVGLAGEVRSTSDTARAAQGIASGAALARASQHGVSVDEEMVDMVRYQRALEASARLMTTVDQMLDVLVNRVGIVGR